MTVKQLRAFLAVAQTLSFSMACERLHLSQSALSLAIKSLEAQLGGALFQRTTRHVKLTPEGEALWPMARQLLADWDDVQDAMRQRFSLQQGQVTLASMPAFAGSWLPTMLKDFRQRYPHIAVKVQDVVNEEVIERVRRGQVELGICFAPPSMDGLKFEPLYLDHFVAAIAPDAPYVAAISQDSAVLPWRDLLSMPMVLLQRPSSVREMVERFLKAHHLEAEVAFESHQLATVGAMVSAGLGGSIVPAFSAAMMRAQGALCYALPPPALTEPVGLVYSCETKLSVAAQAIFETLYAWKPFLTTQLALPALASTPGLPLD